MNTLGIYLHIPFCRSKCDYCDFYSLAGRENRMDDYQAALLKHLVRLGARADGMPVDTVYLGGGTPSWYGAQRVSGLLNRVKECFSVLKTAEITMEANPDSVTRKDLDCLRERGVNRLSMGMQSAHDSELACIHRPHNFEQVRKAVEAARQAGFENVSLDLIYGLPGQSEESWQDSVEQALSLNPEHLSCYGLTVEEGTPLAQRVEGGEILPDDDEQANRYLWTVDRLAGSGYFQYEISNFSKPGRESRHNLRYWNGQPYMGVGPAAHSDFGGCRYSYVRDLERYIRDVGDESAILASCDRISPEERTEEYVMLRLRTANGIRKEEFPGDFQRMEEKMHRFVQQGWMRCDDGRWHLTPQGFLLSNRLIVELLE